MSKQDMNRQLTQNQKGSMSDDPKDGARNSETLGRDGAPTALERAPEEDEQSPEAFGRKGSAPAERE